MAETTKVLKGQHCILVKNNETGADIIAFCDPGVTFSQENVSELENPELVGENPTIENAAFACDQVVEWLGGIDEQTVWPNQSTQFVTVVGSFVGTVVVPPIKGR
jgi:hypothetical protein